jgi:serine/threonine protein kinase
MAEVQGQPFGKYVLLDRIATGGMAEIYRAKYVAAAGVTKPVVIKRILPHFAGRRSFLSMFINEAKIAVALAHGNIAQVFDFGEIDGEYFLAMEYVDGQALSLLQRRASELSLCVPVPVSTYIAAEVCNGLHYAHSRTGDGGQPLGIVHRDVSPQNVIVSFEGQVKVVDFGIAKMLSASQADDHETSAFKGKYLYFSPEQARHRPLDRRSDIFAVGVLLYEMLAGKRPFEGKMLEVLSRIARGDYPRLRHLNPELSPQLEEVVLRAMAVRPEDRYPTALEMHDALRRCLHEGAPSFSSSLVGHFAQYLCQEDLLLQGQTVKLPPEFLAQIPAWRRTQDRVTHPEVMRSVTSEQRGRGRSPTVETAVEVNPWSPRSLAGALGRRKPWLLALVLFAAGFSAVLLLRPLVPARYALRVTSTPDGAAISVDGRPTGRASPAVIEGLDGEREHQLRLHLSGWQPFEQRLAPHKDRELALHGRLVPVEAERSEPAKVTAPVAEAVLDPKSRGFLVPASKAARVTLDPRRTYRLTLLGSAAGARARHHAVLRSVYFFGERADGARAEGSYGQLSPGMSVTVDGLRAIYGFVIAAARAEDATPLRVRIVDLRSRKVASLVVDPSRHAIEPDPSAFLRMGDLDPETSYLLTVTGAGDLGAGGGVSRRVCFYCGPGEVVGAPPADRGQGIVSSGGRAVVRGARELWLFVPDDDLSDNAGSFTAQLTVAPGTKK